MTGQLFKTWVGFCILILGCTPGPNARNTPERIEGSWQFLQFAEGNLDSDVDGILTIDEEFHVEGDLDLVTHDEHEIHIVAELSGDFEQEQYTNDDSLAYFGDITITTSLIEVDGEEVENEAPATVEWHCILDGEDDLTCIADETEIRLRKSENAEN